LKWKASLLLTAGYALTGTATRLKRSMVAVRGRKLRALLALDIVAEVDLPPQPVFDHRLALRMTPRDFPAPPEPEPGSPSLCVAAWMAAFITFRYYLLLLAMAALLTTTRFINQMPAEPDYETSARQTLAAVFDKRPAGDGCDARHGNAINALMLDDGISALRLATWKTFGMPSEKWAKYEVRRRFTPPAVPFGDCPRDFSIASRRLVRACPPRLSFRRDAEACSVRAKRMGK
jgi:hypothetical protein